MQHKQFPANPSLEHLKSQAKQLLKGHKDGSPDAFQRIHSFFPKLAGTYSTHRGTVNDRSIACFSITPLNPPY